MSVFDRVLTGVKDVLLIREEVSRLARDQIELKTGVLDHEKRLIRIETMVEMTGRGGARRRLPND